MFPKKKSVIQFLESQESMDQDLPRQTCQLTVYTFIAAIESSLGYIPKTLQWNYEKGMFQCSLLDTETPHIKEFVSPQEAINHFKSDKYYYCHMEKEEQRAKYQLQDDPNILLTNVRNGETQLECSNNNFKEQFQDDTFMIDGYLDNGNTRFIEVIEEEQNS